MIALFSKFNPFRKYTFMKPFASKILDSNKREILDLLGTQHCCPFSIRVCFSFSFISNDTFILLGNALFTLF